MAFVLAPGLDSYYVCAFAFGLLCYLNEIFKGALKQAEQSNPDWSTKYRPLKEKTEATA